MGEHFRRMLSKVFWWRKKPPPPLPIKIVGEAYLEHYHDHWKVLQDRFNGYIRANSDGADMFKNLSIEEVARMSVEGQLMFPLESRKP